ncbi:hypothetical protein BMH32_01755 [Leucobacter sp. OLJS4]|uniref:hypothetical protein n=1 Tax=unclassified Leucobacter TaxID=2621730 RepID=UPI000C19A86E|nr:MULTISPECIES: hypothetical protein [unclassified Leucobacter]PIJ52561.1 hypothetical protein BMH30_02675 [Leucobacter sp. OLES1]PII84490.1 hypothetical protein BMH25_04345 [Leucobacter sp. OLCALW19]PII88727.1 hypothetical protein BMH26_05080 [Leucobacter sp. OLTLW20]PII90915.1 hypothetical protein BMH27_09090 [Leucobacter sp. OLAS13]PII97662.1 hypothetical protein BMH29_10610 [Leucobacter sp. OLDS2]
MTIDWIAFLQVFVAALVSACVVVALYALGIRFLAIPAPAPLREDGTREPNGPSRDDEDDDLEQSGRPRWAQIAANVCFGLSALCVLAGIYLIIPIFHK